VPASRGAGGVFLTLEGPEGAGKTTQARLLVAHLRAAGREVLHLREPGGTEIGERIRALLLDPRYRAMAARTEMLLFAAARAQLVAEVIAPALARGTLVVCDRYVDASLAYQGAGRGLGIEVVRDVNAVATGGLVPDLTLLLDLEPAVGLGRLREAAGQGPRPPAPPGAGGGPPDRWDGGDRLEREALAFHERVREGFLSLARNEPERIRVIDARRAVADVQREIQEVVEAFLQRRGGRRVRSGRGCR